MTSAKPRILSDHAAPSAPPRCNPPAGPAPVETMREALLAVLQDGRYLRRQTVAKVAAALESAGVMITSKQNNPAAR